MKHKQIVFDELKVLTPHVHHSTVDLLQWTKLMEERFENHREASKKSLARLIELNAPQVIIQSQQRTVGKNRIDFKAALLDQHVVTMLRNIYSIRGRMVNLIEILSDHLMNRHWLDTQRDACFGKQREVAGFLSGYLIFDAIDSIMNKDPEVAKWNEGDDSECAFALVRDKIENTLRKILQRKIQFRQRLQQGQ